RLVRESSPYLRQHAHNPVDWHSWGDAAFELARQNNKPVFLSIGYSTCHWCHVMEHESFDNEEIAFYLNEHFVSIKLDREQRPDLDDIYMTGVQLMSGQGGWPMSNFITADGKPFFAGTYYPPAAFMELLQQINKVWHERPDEVLAQAEQIATNIGLHTAAKSEVKAIEQDLVPRATAELLGRLDALNGGFGGAPKFPNESQLLVLLEDLDRRQDEATGSAVALTLDKMSQGGIFDQVGGGFHRYTVDAIWLVPHFEKMLYNQAQLIRVFAKGYQLTGSDAYLRVMDRTIRYVLRDMTGPDGRFYSATDADSEGEEGIFFVWQPDELAAILLREDAELIRDLYQVTESGNFEGASILNLAGSLESFAAQREIPFNSFLTRLDAIHERLYQAREAREHPLRDEKFITAWNGMLISALVQADLLSGQSDYAVYAVTAAESLWQKHFSSNLKSSFESSSEFTDEPILWRAGLGAELSIAGNLEDYAYFAEACFQLYLKTAAVKWQERGQTLLDLMLERFWDEAAGGFFFAVEATEGPMISRSKSPMDGAMPSGNSVALMALVLAFESSGNVELEARINKMISAFSGLLLDSPSAFSFMLTGITRFLQGNRDPIQWAANGHLRLSVQRSGVGAVVTFELAHGWHINSHDAQGTDLIPTNISAGGKFPDPKEIEVSFSDQPLRVYEGSFDVTVAAGGELLEVSFQACDNAVCLKPETLWLRLNSSK
ncbi:MAG: hypothetical protein ACI82A_000862, partial [Candidatus Azotimanducaceae bacterium]